MADKPATSGQATVQMLILAVMLTILAFGVRYEADKTRALIEQRCVEVGK